MHLLVALPADSRLLNHILLNGLGYWPLGVPCVLEKLVNS